MDKKLIQEKIQKILEKVKGAKKPSFNRQLIIRLIIIFFILWMAIEEFVFKKSIDLSDSPSKKQPLKKIPQKGLTQQIEETAPQKQPEDHQQITEENQPSDQENRQEEPQEEGGQQDQQDQQENKQKEDAPEIPPVDLPSEGAASSTEEKVNEEAFSPPTEEQQKEEEVADDHKLDLPVVTDATSSSLVPENNLEKAPPLIENLEPAVSLEQNKVEFVDPPSYNSRGRGLIYNCQGKHWACLDESEYKQCKQHHTWSRQNKKGPFCISLEVYASDRDCELAQLQKIHLGQAPEDCH